MGQSGTLYFFSERMPRDRVEAARRVLELIGPFTVASCSIYNREDTSWKRYQEELANPEEEPSTPEQHSRWRECSSAAELLAMITEYPVTGGSLYGSLLMDRLGSAIRAALPPEFRDATALCEPGFRIGPHDLWDLPWDSPDDTAVYHGRSQFAVCLSGQSTPPQTRLYEKLIVRVPEIVEFQKSLESILGPLKRCIIWSV